MTHDQQAIIVFGTLLGAVAIGGILSRRSSLPLPWYLLAAVLSFGVAWILARAWCGGALGFIGLGVNGC